MTGGLEDLAVYGKGQLVAQLDAQALGQAFFQRPGGGVVAQGHTCYQPVVVAQAATPAEVELALGQAAGAFVGVFVGHHRLAGNAVQAGTYHGAEHGLGQAGALELGQDAGALLRLDIDGEAVGGIDRDGLVPGTEQVVAHHRQQHQRHQAQR